MKSYFNCLLALLVGLSVSCSSAEERVQLEKLPYFDLKSFLDLELSKLDSVTVSKVSRINGEEKLSENTYTIQDWKEEFELFYKADINLPSLALSYSTDAKFDYLMHKLLPEEKGKVKEIVVRYYKNYPTSITFKMKDENMFFSTSTIGEMYLNQQTGILDHYTIETTQKVVFMGPTNIKVQGIVK
jgi:hypothetical protein